MSRHISTALGFLAGATPIALSARDLIHWLIAILIGLLVACISKLIQYRIERWTWYRRLAKLPTLKPVTPPLPAGMEPLTISSLPPPNEGTAQC